MQNANADVFLFIARSMPWLLDGLSVPDYILKQGEEFPWTFRELQGLTSRGARLFFDPGKSLDEYATSPSVQIPQEERADDWSPMHDKSHPRWRIVIIAPSPEERTASTLQPAHARVAVGFLLSRNPQAIQEEWLSRIGGIIASGMYGVSIDTVMQRPTIRVTKMPWDGVGEYPYPNIFEIDP